jgi:uncharacterized membrane protein YedE/YeeE
MKPLLVSFASGLLFALGLGISGMTQPAKVIGFLDFTGKWDPSLACVMIGATMVHAILYRLIRHRSSPVFTSTFTVPTRRDIDLRLVGGAALFGIGWGIGGFCPGPALTSLPSGHLPVLIFVAAMIVGMYLYTFVESPRMHRVDTWREGTTSRPAAPSSPAFQSRTDY